MQYAVWFVRLIYAAWMIPAGLNHFVPLFPQPGGAVPISQEVFSALIDSGMFTLVKAVELVAGLAVLLGFRLPLMLIAVLPVSFTVWYWDTELQGWWTPSAIYGWAILCCNLFLCYAYRARYYAFFAEKTELALPFAKALTPRLLGAVRLVLGALLAVTAIRYFMPFLLPFVSAHHWADPMAARLMAAFDASGLGAVARFIHVIAGAMLLANRHVPFALAALLPVNLCGAFIALLIEGDALLGLLALLVVAANGLLMLACLPAYKGVLEGGALADGESAGDGQNFASLYVDPRRDAPLKTYLLAAIPLAAALAFFWQVVPFVSSTTGLVVLAFPGAILAIGLARAAMRRA